MIENSSRTRAERHLLRLWVLWVCYVGFLLVFFLKKKKRY